MKSVTNRWGHKLTVGMPVLLSLARGGRSPDIIKSFPAASNFSRAYGKQVLLESGISCGIDDVQPSKRWEFYTHSDGSRARVPFGKPCGPASLVRELYRIHVRDIGNTQALRATLRAGRYTSLSSYPVYYVTNDGGALCWACVKANYRNVSAAVRSKLNDGGWRVVACDVNYEAELICDHCSTDIESAYGIGE